MQNAPREHSAIFLTFIRLPFVFKTFVLSIFEWPLKTGFTVDYSQSTVASMDSIGYQRMEADEGVNNNCLELILYPPLLQAVIHIACWKEASRAV